MSSAIPAWAIALGGLGLVGALYLASSASSASSSDPAYRVDGSTASRDLILARFKAAGFPLALAQAAAVNSYAESSWNASKLSGYRDANGVRENSVGLFQLNAKGLGKALAMPLRGSAPNETVDPLDKRLDPVVNIDTVIAEVRRQVAIMALTGLPLGQGTIARYTDLFCRLVERPADPNGAVAHRVALIPRLFPSVS